LQQIKISNLPQNKEQPTSGITESDDLDPILRSGIGDALISVFFHSRYNELNLAIKIINFWQANIFVSIVDHQSKHQ
jgi:hypothetical protein